MCVLNLKFDVVQHPSVLLSPLVRLLTGVYLMLRGEAVLVFKLGISRSLAVCLDVISLCHCVCFSPHIIAVLEYVTKKPLICYI